MPKPVSLLWVVSFISMFLPLLKTRRKINVSMYVLCQHNFLTQANCIIFFFSLSVYSVYNILKVGMPKNVFHSKDAKKMVKGCKFSRPSPKSTGHKVEMASAKYQSSRPSSFREEAF